MQRRVTQLGGYEALVIVVSRYSTFHLILFTLLPLFDIMYEQYIVIAHNGLFIYICRETAQLRDPKD